MDPEIQNFEKAARSAIELAKQGKDHKVWEPQLSVALVKLGDVLMGLEQRVSSLENSQRVARGRFPNA